MKIARLLITSLMLMMILSCGACGKKGPPMLPKGYSFVGVFDQSGESGPGSRGFDRNQQDLQREDV
jgi:predicted small lipoprotein YifL